MEQNTIAILISGISLTIAGLSLGWNIYRDVILKPRVRVTVYKSMIGSEIIPMTEKLCISAVNYGPGSVRLRMVRFKKSTFKTRLSRSTAEGYVVHDYHNPLSGQLPKSLEVGETITLIFPWDNTNVFAESPTHIGICDSFGRDHWAKKGQVQKTLEQWRSQFAAA